MRYTLIAVVALLGVPCASASVDLRFGEPASVLGEVDITTATWLAARLPEGAQMVIDVPTGGRLVSTNITYPYRLDTPVTFSEGAPSSESSGRPLQPMQLTLVAAAGDATIAMLVDGPIHGRGAAKIVSAGGAAISDLMEDEGAHYSWSDWSTGSQQGVALVSDGALQEVSFRDLNVEAIEWFNMATQCPMGVKCPSGGGAQAEEVGSHGLSLSSKTYRFERLEAAAVATAVWPSARLVATAKELDVATNGEVHLPVTDAMACPACPPIKDQTLTVDGFVALQGIHHDQEGLGASMSGDFETVRIDETWVSPARLGQVGAATAVAIGAAVLVKLLLVPLFTRLGKQQALEHPKRQKIYHYIQEHPGANFREVARNTEIAAGTVRHHLTVLERSGHVVEHAHQGTVRLFENHGKFDHNWSDVVLLREPPLAKLHAWLKANPQSPQKAALEAMELDGWSRSTTQHRLARLVEGGVATIRLQGRLKIYNVVGRAAAPRPLVQLVAPRPAFAT